MKKCYESPDIEWNLPDLPDGNFYDGLSKNLDREARLVSTDFSKSSLHTSRERIYHLLSSTVKLSEATNSSLNQYTVQVHIGVYSPSQNIAKKLLEKILNG